MLKNLNYSYLIIIIEHKMGMNEIMTEDKKENPKKKLKDSSTKGSDDKGSKVVIVCCTIM